MIFIKKFIYIILFLIPCLLSAQPSEWKSIRQIENGKLIVDYYVFKKTDSVNVSDFTFVNDILSQPGVLQCCYPDFNYRVFLLEKGYAKVKDSGNISRAELDAQNKAKNSKSAIWFTKPEEVNTPKIIDTPNVAGTSVLDEALVFASENIFTVKNFLWLLGFLGATLSVKLIYSPIKKLFIERRIRLLLAGDSASGKTALKAVLLDKDIPREKIISLRLTNHQETGKGKTIIPSGR